MNLLNICSIFSRSHISNSIEVAFLLVLSGLFWNEMKQCWRWQSYIACVDSFLFSNFALTLFCSLILRFYCLSTLKSPLNGNTKSFLESSIDPFRHIIAKWTFSHGYWFWGTFAHLFITQIRLRRTLSRKWPIEFFLVISLVKSVWKHPGYH